MRVAVAGGGVVGLCTALEVQKELGPSAQVTVIADKFEEDTTGHGAAGFWLPASYFMGPSYETTRRWLRDSFEWYSDICYSDQAQPAGVSELFGYFFSNQMDVTNHWLIGLLPEYRPASEEELQLYPGGARYGAYAKTLLTECRYMLPWARQRILSNGGRVERRKVSQWTDLAETFDVVFNCTGLGARELCNDHILVPLRGQVYKVVAPWIKRFTIGDDDTYIIPNREVVTLGGSRHLGNFNLNVDPHESASIWDRCLRLDPSLARARVQCQWVGLRPFRCPVRVEAERVNLTGSPLTIVHNYGHGGYGITAAPGTAKHAVTLLTDLHKSSVGSSKL